MVSRTARGGAILLFRESGLYSGGGGARLLDSLMTILMPILVTLHVLVCILMVIVVLMQRPRSEGLGSAFGGGITDNVFGSQTTTVLARFTSWMAIGFFAITLLLSILTAKASSGKTEIQKKLLSAPVPEAVSEESTEATAAAETTPATETAPAAATVEETVVETEPVEIPAVEEAQTLPPEPAIESATGEATSEGIESATSGAAEEAQPVEETEATVEN
jgi:preprotein translocase subunit SecG